MPQLALRKEGFERATLAKIITEAMGDAVNLRVLLEAYPIIMDLPEVGMSGSSGEAAAARLGLGMGRRVRRYR